MFFSLYCLTARVSENKNMTIIEHDVRVISNVFKDFRVIKDLHGEVPTLLKFKFKKWYKITQSGKGKLYILSALLHKILEVKIEC